MFTYRWVKLYTDIPVLCSSRCWGLKLLQTLLEKFFVLIDKMFLHLRHLSHDLLPPESSHLRLPLPLRLVFVSHHLQDTTGVCRYIKPLINRNTRWIWKLILKHLSLLLQYQCLTSSGPCPEMMLTVDVDDVRSLIVLMFATICANTMRSFIVTNIVNSCYNMLWKIYCYIKMFQKMGSVAQPEEFTFRIQVIMCLCTSKWGAFCRLSNRARTLPEVLGASPGPEHTGKRIRMSGVRDRAEKFNQPNTGAASSPKMFVLVRHDDAQMY